jgi:hypothetical protein
MAQSFDEYDRLYIVSEQVADRACSAINLFVLSVLYKEWDIVFSMLFILDFSANFYYVQT